MQHATGRCVGGLGGPSPPSAQHFSQSPFGTLGGAMGGGAGAAPRGGCPPQLDDLLRVAAQHSPTTANIVHMESANAQARANLIAMGFAPDQVAHALAACGGDEADAVNMLVDGKTR